MKTDQKWYDQRAGVLVSFKITAETKDVIMSTMVQYPDPISTMADIERLEKAVIDKLNTPLIQVLSFSRLELEG